MAGMAFDGREGSNVKIRQVIRRVSCGVATVVFAGPALVGLGSAPASAAAAGKGAYTTISIQGAGVVAQPRSAVRLNPTQGLVPADHQPGAGVVAQPKSAVRLTTRELLPADHQPGAFILCELGSPLGIVSTSVNLEVEFRMACKWTDDGSLAPEVVLNEVACAIQESPPNGRVYGVRGQPGTGPTGGCQTLTPLAPLFGTYSGVVQAEVFLSGDPTGYISPVYYTANSITVV